MSEQIQQPAVAAAPGENEEEWDEEEYDDQDGEDEDDDGDIDAEAEEMARRLGEQLQGLSNFPEPLLAGAEQPEKQPPQNAFAEASSATSKKQEAAIVTIKAILALLEKDAVAHATLASTAVSNASAGSVLDALKNALATGSVTKELSGPLSQSLVALARSEALFGNLRHSNASSIQLDLGKRKREQHDDGAQTHTPRPPKKPFLPSPDLYTTVSEAVRIVSHALSTSTSTTLDSNLVASIQHPLHHIFLFAVTSSARGGPEMNALQEIGGLIQVLGVLSGIQIGQMPMPDPERELSNAPTDIGTAVYPCMTAGCRKVFSRLFSLRGHHRVHSAHRPFRCESCPASFTRNHDLKRHSKMHERKAWKCIGCDKLFSRRDAIRRHKNASQAKGGKQACVESEILEVEGDASEDASREEKRARIWNGIANHEAIYPSAGYQEGIVEDGEIPLHVMAATQGAVLHLHPILQSYVSNASGMSVPSAVPLDPTGGQATLASVIARAQSQSIPPPTPSQPNGDLDAPISTTNPVPADPPVTSQEKPAVEPEPVQSPGNSPPLPTLSMYGLSDEQTKLLEEAITNAALAAQAQAEAEAALEEDYDDLLDEDDEGSNMDVDEVESGSMLPDTT
ncbi:hypothetical protein VKT23_001372 [Stygiomarasmius scandens]|uniref:C2H2-type domain-containing protein n=1 Tax=Marasmiellus scandens TaxID=2682957 RepID=A0ABR1K9C8_9AGAR